MKKVMHILAVSFLSVFAHQLWSRTLTVTNMADLGLQGEVRVEQVDARGARTELGTVQGADEDYRYQTESWDVPSQMFIAHFEYTNKGRWPSGATDLKIEAGNSPIVIKIDAPKSVRRLQ